VFWRRKIGIASSWLCFASHVRISTISEFGSWPLWHSFFIWFL